MREIWGRQLEMTLALERLQKSAEERKRQASTSAPSANTGSGAAYGKAMDENVENSMEMGVDVGFEAGEEQLKKTAPGRIFNAAGQLFQTKSDVDTISKGQDTIRALNTAHELYEIRKSGLMEQTRAYEEIERRNGRLTAEQSKDKQRIEKEQKELDLAYPQNRVRILQDNLMK